MKIVSIEPLGVTSEIMEDMQKTLEDKGHEFLWYDTKPENQEEILSRAKGAQGIIVANYPVDKATFDQLDEVEFVNVAFTGTDHLGETKALMSNASGYSDTAVSELVIGLVLGFYRQIPTMDQRTRKGLTGSPGSEIRGKKVGIVGLGKIGMATAKLFEAFGSEISYFSRSKKDVDYDYKSLEELLKQSDIVSIHLPLNEHTKGMIGEKELSLMKKDALLVNCARGPIVDEKALTKALKEQKIGGACIDVFDKEPPLDEKELFAFENVLLTPHIAYLTHESMVRRAAIVMENIEAYLEGNPKNVVKR